MSESQPTFDKMRTGIQAIVSWIGGQRTGDSERNDDLVVDPSQDSIQFTSLSPSSGAPEVLRSFSLLSDAWIRRHSDSFQYERAAQLVSQNSVVLITAEKAKLAGCVNDIDTMSPSVSLDEHGLITTCSCEAYKRYVDASSGPTQWLACVHITALLLHAVKNELISVANTADIAAVCPVTRQSLDTQRVIYRCQRCQLSFSPEGWQFLKQMDRGRCCGCHTRNSIHAQSADLER